MDIACLLNSWQKQKRVAGLKYLMFEFKHDDLKTLTEHWGNSRRKNYLPKTLVQRSDAHDPVFVGFFYQNAFSCSMHDIICGFDLFDVHPQITGVSTTLFIKGPVICDDRLKIFTDRQ